MSHHPLAIHTAYMCECVCTCILKFLRRVVFERMSFLPDSAIGKPYGSQFQVKGHILVSSQRTDTAAQYVTGAVTIEQDKDNRRIVDDGSSQTLTSEDIHHMKEEGRSGQVCIKKPLTSTNPYCPMMQIHTECLYMYMYIQ